VRLFHASKRFGQQTLWRIKGGDLWWQRSVEQREKMLNGLRRGNIMSLGTILIILLILALIGVLPTWGYSTGWGYAPGGVVGVLLVILIILALTGRI
jgi:hypothetical protein